MSMKVLLIGASGRTGRALADLLLKQQDFEVTALVRRPDFALPGAKVVVADLTGTFRPRSTASRTRSTRRARPNRKARPKKSRSTATPSRARPTMRRRATCRSSS